MKRTILKVTAAAVVMLGAAVSVQAQSAANIEYGRSVLSFDQGFTSSLGALGATIGGVGFSSVDDTGTIVFPVSGGTFDLATAVGEINQVGGISVNSGGPPIRLQNFIVNTEGSTPTVTAILVVNNKVINRIPLFDLTLPQGTTVPLATQVGVLQLNGCTLSLDPNGAAAINGVFGGQVVQGGTYVGILSLYLVLSPNAAS